MYLRLSETTIKTMLGFILEKINRKLLLYTIFSLFTTNN